MLGAYLAKKGKRCYDSAMRLPPAFCNRMQRELGDDYAAFLASYQEDAQKGLRVNRGYIADEKLLPLLRVPYEPVPYQAGAYYYRGYLGQHPLHQAGAFYLQDPSAMLTAAAVAIEPHHLVLDLCAAPGGKSTQLAPKVPQGLLVSNEIDLGRAKILMGNLERMGYANTMTTSLAPAVMADLFGAVFDVVVVDAPCSGEGMFRKTPAAVDEWSEANVDLCAARQKEILDAAARLVKEGGLLVYSTCTFSHQENEQSVRYLLDTGDFEGQMPTPEVVAATVAGDMPFCRRFYPHLGRGEGHFVAVLRRTKAADVPPKMAPKRLLSAKERQATETFLQVAAGHVPTGELCYVNNQVCLVPRAMPVPPYGALSAGVKLGELQASRKGLRIEPHHMLFKCLPLLQRLDLAWDDPRVAQYLHGESLSLDVPDGWGTMCVEGCPVGGYKAVDGILKNHYPKGLRV